MQLFLKSLRAYLLSSVYILEKYRQGEDYEEFLSFLELPRNNNRHKPLTIIFLITKANFHI